MLFIETPTFTKQITTLLPDDAYKELQSALMANPDAGDLIKGVAVFGNCAGVAPAAANVAGFAPYISGARNKIRS